MPRIAGIIDIVIGFWIMMFSLFNMLFAHKLLPLIFLDMFFSVVLIFIGYLVLRNNMIGIILSWIAAAYFIIANIIHFNLLSFVLWLSVLKIKFLFVND